MAENKTKKGTKRIVKALAGHIRVNVAVRRVEIYNDYGVQLVLDNLDDKTFEEFKNTYENF